MKKSLCGLVLLALMLPHLAGAKIWNTEGEVTGLLYTYKGSGPRAVEEKIAIMTPEQRLAVLKELQRRTIYYREAFHSRLENEVVDLNENEENLIDVHGLAAFVSGASTILYVIFSIEAKIRGPGFVKSQKTYRPYRPARSAIIFGALTVWFAERGFDLRKLSLSKRNLAGLENELLAIQRTLDVVIQNLEME